MPSSHIAAPIPTNLFIRLSDFLRANDSASDPVEVIATAVEYWLDNASWKEELIPDVRPQFRGYQWKSILLPPGTKVRMKYKGTVHHAEVNDDDLVWNGKKTTPSDFANTVAGGTARNAWRDLWIKRPLDLEFRLADELRRTSSGRGS